MHSKPLFDLPALDPTFMTANEWLVYWTKLAWNYPKTNPAPKAHDLSEALRHVDAPLERVLLINVFRLIWDGDYGYGSILTIYDETDPCYIPRIPEIDEYLSLIHI